MTSLTDPSGHAGTSPCLSRDGEGYGAGCHSSGGSARHDVTSTLANTLTARRNNTQVAAYVNLKNATSTSYPEGQGFVNGAAAANYAVLAYYEAPDREWDIKLGMRDILGRGIILCGETHCGWYDYSVPGNIQFGYVAGLMDIDRGIGNAVGGIAQNFDNWRQGVSQELPCVGLCDDPRDQAAVDFGRQLAQNYPNGITPTQLRHELTVDWTSQFQPPPANYIPPYPAGPGNYVYSSDYFDQR